MTHEPDFQRKKGGRWAIPSLLVFALAVCLPIPWAIVRLTNSHISPGWEVFLTGLSITGAAFLCAWSGELAQYDVSRSLAMAGLAIITVLPEYAVDIYLAWQAGKRPEYIDLAAANMTGANRLLVGVGWSLTAFLAMLALRRKGSLRGWELPLGEEQALEGLFLAAANLYALIFFFTREIALHDGMLLTFLFAGYMWAVSRAPHHEPEPVGPVALMAQLPTGWRRGAIAAMLTWGGFSIFIATEPFSEGLIHLGKAAGIDEFLLIQWIAPLASESPELIIVFYFAWRGIAGAAMTAIISSKINQWTLLIGSLAFTYGLSTYLNGNFQWALPLRERPHEEVFLTCCQSFFALAVIANLRITLLEAGALFTLFSTQLFLPGTDVRYGFSVAYLFLTGLCLFRYRESVTQTFQIGLRLMAETKPADPVEPHAQQRLPDRIKEQRPDDPDSQ